MKQELKLLLRFAVATFIIPQALSQSIFESVFRPTGGVCAGDNREQGTCLTRAQCLAAGGQLNGLCNNGLGQCCYFKVTCNGKTSRNETVFVNPHYPEGENGTETCQVTVEKQPNVCQLRLDFEEFSLAQPDMLGLCTKDTFMVRTTVGERLPILCGENKHQHLYIEMGRGSGNPVVLSVMSHGDKMTRKWKIKITMIACNSMDMAPQGCIQYHRSPSGTIRSFNFGPPIEGRLRYLSNLKYSICLRVEENFCSIKWETETTDSFSWGMPADMGASGAVCKDDDFIVIDQGSHNGHGAGEDRFCGSSLLDRNVIISRSKPFMLKVKSNSVAKLNANNSQHGFALRYTELPCMI